MQITYHMVLFIIFCILNKTMSINLMKRLEKSEKIYLFHRRLVYVCLLQLMQKDLPVVLRFQQMIQQDNSMKLSGGTGKTVAK